MILPFINPCYCGDSRVHNPMELVPTSKRRRSDVSGAEEQQIPSEEGSEEYRNTEEAGSASRVDVGSRRGTSTSIARSHMVSLDLPVCRLDCKNAWETLTKQEKHYAHHFCQAAWAGARICAFQPSQEGPLILKVLCLVFSGEPVGIFKERCFSAGIREQEWKYFGAFAACFLTNMGNYLAFGETKIIPGISKERLNIIINLCSLQDERKQRLQSLWNEVKEKLYSLKPEERRLGVYPKGISMYYSQNITREDIDLVQAHYQWLIASLPLELVNHESWPGLCHPTTGFQTDSNYITIPILPETLAPPRDEWMGHHGVEPWNTRIWRPDVQTVKEGEQDLPVYELRTASSLKLPTEVYTYKDKCVIHIVYGDFQKELIEVVDHLKNALDYTSNDDQKAMIEQYIKHFETGSINAHKESQRHWINDKGSTLEINIGFIETYRDPVGIRAEFEGFVAVVDKEESLKYAKLVEAAEEILPTLPWPKEFEKDVFHKPEFSSIDVIAYANSSIPAGINIPNYEDFRQNYGFKNVKVGNVLAANKEIEKLPFLKDNDQGLFRKLKGMAFDIQIACHELLGHGSGKLFMRRKDGTHNYDHGKLVHPFTKELVLNCYGPGQTMDTVFGSLSSAFEECRAECVGLYLSSNALVLEIFGHTGDDANDVTYINWLLMARAGLFALEFFKPKTGDWHQAHMQARFVILRVLLEASEAESKEGSTCVGEDQYTPFLQVQRTESGDVLLLLERNKIKTVGVPALSRFLGRLQVYKSTADIESARAMFTELSGVPEDLLSHRKLVLANKNPRPLFVQVNTAVDDSCVDGIMLLDYPATFEGLIESFVRRFEKWINTC